MKKLNRNNFPEDQRNTVRHLKLIEAQRHSRIIWILKGRDVSQFLGSTEGYQVYVHLQVNPCAIDINHESCAHSISDPA